MGYTLRESSNEIQERIINTMEFSMGNSCWAEVDRNWECRELSAPFNRLYLVRSGSARLWGGGKEYEMRPGMAFLVPAGMPCSYSCPDRMKKLYFHFNCYRPDRYDLLWGCGQIGSWEVPEALVEKLVRCQSGVSFLDAVTVQQWILGVTADYLRERGLGRDSVISYSEAVADTIDYIRKHLSARLQVEELASRRFVSKTYLREKFRHETGIPLGRYIDEQLIMEAQRRLSQKEDTIGTISRDLGFSDQFYFSRRFTQLCGLSPQVYRKNIK